MIKLNKKRHWFDVLMTIPIIPVVVLLAVVSTWAGMMVAAVSEFYRFGRDV